MKMVESTQNKYDMEPTSRDNPKLLLTSYLWVKISIFYKDQYLAFVKKHNLWKNYYIAYSNGSSESEFGDKQFMEKVDTYMAMTKQQNKKGSRLIIRVSRKLGITYQNCDVTIH